MARVAKKAVAEAVKAEAVAEAVKAESKKTIVVSEKNTNSKGDKVAQLMADIEARLKEEIVIESWHIGCQTFRNKQYVFIREFYQNEAGDMCPGKRGLNIPLSLLRSIISAFVK